ncbi:unnamed protein product [Absidia cylindrospora]
MLAMSFKSKQLARRSYLLGERINGLMTGDNNSNKTTTFDDWHRRPLLDDNP